MNEAAEEEVVEKIEEVAAFLEKETDEYEVVTKDESSKS